jgi:lipopolysaccharide transport system ATP-binding protein
MSDDIVISVENISKAYRIWNDPGARLKSPFVGTCGALFPQDSEFRRKLEAKATHYYRDFFALKDISFQTCKGESIGIIGRNGSGKSTLLQIIAGTLRPTTGSVHITGRVAALLELGSGFNPDFTGRENVYLNAAVLGLSRAETDTKFDAIATFADIGDFLDQPVKTYSSGMLVRLAFAVQTAVEPDILIVDEALSVGDFFFQQKCFKRIRELRETGTTLLFVSHDMASVRDLCSRALYLRSGHAACCGSSASAIAMYFKEGDTSRQPTPDFSVPEPPPIATAIHSKSPSLTAIILPSELIWTPGPRQSVPTGPAELLGVEVRDSQDRLSLKHRMGETAIIRGYFRTLQVTTLHAAIEIKNRHGQLVSSLGSRIAGLSPAAAHPGQVWCFEAQIQLGIESGLYTFQFCLGRPHPAPNLGQRLAETPWLGPITVEWDYTTATAPFLGMFHLPATIALRSTQG